MKKIDCFIPYAGKEQAEIRMQEWSMPTITR